jgi:hypothetical protein
VENGTRLYTVNLSRLLVKKKKATALERNLFLLSLREVTKSGGADWEPPLSRSVSIVCRTGGLQGVAAMEDICEGKEDSVPRQEEKILHLWEELNAFETQLQRTEGKPEYIFYDGPPFATGLPHYGHILAGTIKDIVTRYQSARGHHVTRRFGWDCHGLPVEHEIDKKLGIRSKDDVLAMGIDKYNEECRSIVMRYSKEWEKTVTRMGRWIDFQNDYKTLDPEFMESVWWVFKQLFEKGYVYQGLKVRHFRAMLGLGFKERADSLLS